MTWLPGLQLTRFVQPRWPLQNLTGACASPVLPSPPACCPADADPTGPLSVEEQALEQAAHACQALEDAVQEVVKAVVASTQLQQPGSSIAPKLPVPPHVVVVAPTRVYVACYQRYVEDARCVARWGDTVKHVRQGQGVD